MLPESTTYCLDALGLPLEYTPRALAEAVEAYLLRLQPIGDVPLYVVSVGAESSPQVQHTIGDATGVYFGGSDFIAQHDLADRWRGRGRALLVREQTRDLPLDSSDLVREVCANSAALVFLAIAVHEFAHGIETHGNASPAEPTGWQSQAAAWLDWAAVTPPSPWAPPFVPWHKHGLRFHRALIHLLYRTGELREELAFCVCAGVEYSLPPLADMAAALGNEPAATIHVPIWDTLDTRAPAAFEALFPAGALEENK